MYGLFRIICQANPGAVCGISINALARMSGVKQSTLDNIVRGLTKNPRVMTLHKLALAFSMTLSEFLDFRELSEYAFDEEPD